MQPEQAEIRFLRAAIEKHRQNLYALELQAIDYGPLAVPLYLRNAAAREQEQLAIRQERLEIALAAIAQDTERPAPNSVLPLTQELPNPAVAPPAGPSMQFGDGTRLTGANVALGSHITGDFNQTTHWGR